MKISAIFAAAALLGATVPAIAAAPADQSKMKLTYDAKHDKYCFSEAVTGTRLPQKDCRSREEWAQAGVVFPDQNDMKLAAK